MFQIPNHKAGRGCLEWGREHYAETDMELHWIEFATRVIYVIMKLDFP